MCTASDETAREYGTLICCFNLRESFAQHEDTWEYDVRKPVKTNSLGSRLMDIYYNYLVSPDYRYADARAASSVSVKPALVKMELVDENHLTASSILTDIEGAQVRPSLPPGVIARLSTYLCSQLDPTRAMRSKSPDSKELVSREARLRRLSDHPGHPEFRQKYEHNGLVYEVAIRYLPVDADARRRDEVRFRDAPASAHLCACIAVRACASVIHIGVS